MPWTVVRRTGALVDFKRRRRNRSVVVKVAVFYLGSAPYIGHKLAAGQGLVRVTQEKFHESAFPFGKGKGDRTVLEKVLLRI